MRRATSEWSIRMLADLEGRISVAADYQRGVVWSEAQQMLLIDSILRGFDLPKIFLRKLPDGSLYLFEVIDGVQRLTSIWQYLSDQFRLPSSYKYSSIESVGGKKWSELSQDAQDRIQFSKITVTEIETEEENEVRELFQRLQEGEPLNAAEKRNAMEGNIRDFVADTLANHPLWPLTRIRKKRLQWHELSTIVLALVKANGPTGLKGADLEKLYEENRDFDTSSLVATRTIAWLDYLHAIASVDQGQIRTRWGIVDLLLSLQQLEEGRVTPKAEDVMRFFAKFEQERRDAAAALSDLRSTVVGFTRLQPDSVLELELPDIEPSMLTYINAFTREGATKDNVAVRAGVMVKRLTEYLRAV